MFHHGRCLFNERIIKEAAKSGGTSCCLLIKCLQDFVCNFIEFLDAKLNIRNGVIPVILVFNGEITFELLFFQDFEHVFDAQATFTPNGVFLPSNAFLLG